MNFALSETVVQKLNTALGIRGEPHNVVHGGEITETGAMEWSETPSVATIMANLSPELKDAIQRSQQYLQQQGTDLSGKLAEFFSKEPANIQAQYKEYITKLQRASSPLVQPPEMPEISRELQEALKRIEERLQGKYFIKGEFDLENYLKHADEFFQEEPAAIQAERALVASKIQAMTEAAQTTFKRKKLILKQVRTLLADDRVTAYRAGIEWEGVPSLSYHTIVVASTVDPFDILRIEGTNGANHGLSADDLIEKLKYLDKNYGLDIVGAVYDGVELILKRIPKGKEAQELGKWLLDICPDLYAPISFPGGRVTLWWD